MPNSKTARFALVGVINTLIDVVIFLILRQFGLSVFVSNIFSTSVALMASFTLNRKFTFRSGAFDRRTIMQFVGVTLIGLWLLQPLIIKLVMAVDGQLGVTAAIASLIGYQSVLADLVPKIASIAVTLVWNFVWYNKVIFAAKNDDSATVKTTESF